MLKPQREKCTNDYSLEVEDCQGKFIFGSMDNISVTSLNIPNSSKSDQEKVISTQMMTDYPDDDYVVANRDEGTAIIFIYNKEWISTHAYGVHVIPEIYLVPFDSGLISVCSTKTGYIVRESEHSGFRLADPKVLKHYLEGKRYNLYSLGETNVNNRWSQLNKGEVLVNAWKDYPNRHKITASISFSRNQKSLLLLFLIAISWGGIFYQINNQSTAIENTIAKLDSEMQNSVKYINIDNSNFTSFDVKKVISDNYSAKYLAFKNLLSYHGVDSFSIKDDRVKVFSNNKGMPALSGFEVNYDK